MHTHTHCIMALNCRVSLQINAFNTRTLYAIDKCNVFLYLIDLMHMICLQ